MCSVVGYIGKGFSRSFVLEGLSRLEYRGYDAAGFACINPQDHRLLYLKSSGKLEDLVAKLSTETIDGNLGIGHTRWASHGDVAEHNAHPQFDCNKAVAVVHNGIIENHHELKPDLIKQGHVFYSHTDTEIIAHLFESLSEVSKSFKQTIVELVGMLEGAYAFILISQDHPDEMVLVRKRSPLCVGIGDGEMFVASDVLAFAGKTNSVLFLPDESFAIVQKDTIKLYDFMGKRLEVCPQTIHVDWSDQGKNGHEHYMLKEIYEQKNGIVETVAFLRSITQHVWDYLGITQAYARDLKGLCLIASGTSWHAASIGQFFFESVCKTATRVFLSSEFRYMPFFSTDQSLHIALSQSGETADTLEALRLVNNIPLPTAVLTNVPSSTMVREAGGFLLTQVGPEVAVASTKSFSSQLAVLYWLAHRLAVEKGLLKWADLMAAEDDLVLVAEILENTIEIYKRDIVQIHAKKYAHYKKAIFLGRHISYPFSLEAALKLKEIAYVFAQGYPAGELKHGPLALVDDETPIFVFSHQDKIIYQKLISNVQEVKARGGHVVAFAFEGQNELCRLADTCFVIPHVKPLLGPLAMTGLMQFFIYAIARESALPIDKPRNLAKSVTVE